MTADADSKKPEPKPEKKRGETLFLGERIAVNLSHLGHSTACVGTVIEVKGVNAEQNRAVVFYVDEDNDAQTRVVPLIDEQRATVWVPLQPGCWASLEKLHKDPLGGLFGI